MKLTIVSLGQPKEVKTKFGVKQKSYIKAEEYADKFLSYWITSSTQNWKIGDSVDVENVTSREYEGKTYYDIVMPRASGGVPAELVKSIEQILSYQTKANLMLAELLEEKRNKVPYPEGEPEMPFPDEDKEVPF